MSWVRIPSSAPTFYSKRPAQMLMMCGFYIMVRTEKPAPLLQHRSRKHFHLLWWGPPDVPPPCISWKCCRKAASVNIADVAGYHRRILYYCLIIQYLSSGTQADLMIPYQEPATICHTRNDITQIRFPHLSIRIFAEESATVSFLPRSILSWRPDWP